MISIHHLFPFVTILSLLLISITDQRKIEFAFLNGFNVIRCSDNQVQVYEPQVDYKRLSSTLKCDNKNVILDTGYAGFLWHELRIICTSSPGQVHEEFVVKRAFGGQDVSDRLPDAQGQLRQKDALYELQIESHDDGENTIIKSKDQPANNDYFKGARKMRTIFLRFKNHPIVCRIKFVGKENNPCLSGKDQEVDEVDYVCYYNPNLDQPPTAIEMSAEINQVDAAEKPDDITEYVLNIGKPTASSDDTADSDDDGTKPLHPNAKRHSKIFKDINAIMPNNARKAQEKYGVLKIVGFILGTILLLALIGAVIFFFIRKNRSQSSTPTSSSSVNIENGNNKYSSSVAVNDANIESMINEPSDEGKPNMTSQSSAANKHQRTGTSMAFNDDI